LSRRLAALPESNNTLNVSRAGSGEVLAYEPASLSREEEIVPRQIAVAEKSNGIWAIPKLPDVKGAVDAVRCQPESKRRSPVKFTP
jgi:hypothetical protein